MACRGRLEPSIHVGNRSTSYSDPVDNNRDLRDNIRRHSRSSARGTARHSTGRDGDRNKDRDRSKGRRHIGQRSRLLSL